MSAALSCFPGGKPPTTLTKNAMMMAALRGGHEAVVDDLLRAGARPNDKEKITGDLPLNVASFRGRVNAVISLLRDGADIEKPDSRGRAPLHLAAERGHLPVVYALLAVGASVDEPDDEG